MLPAVSSIGSLAGDEQFPVKSRAWRKPCTLHPMPSQFRQAVLLTFSACICLFVLEAAGCAGLDRYRPSGPLVTRATDGKTMLAPDLRTSVYETNTVAAAEVYLTDLPVSRLSDPRDDLTGLSGTILQLRVFIIPRAGRTPITDTACNVMVRQIVLSASAEGQRPEVGVYGGGGFMAPSDDPGAASIGGNMNVTLRPLGATAGFLDLLGTSELSGGFNAKQDAKISHALAACVQRLLDVVERAPGETPEPQSTSMASPKE
jgi:hypothetical protein